ncbi:RNA polymerase sigma-70 factor [Labilithrix luteola]|uniref:RNA polymerase sigma-70 factor n=1 Tax=Labilithrix luteola TaxID=1391654 RepID=A0A0K1PR45_9BACT|nr:sigma-70 family RNA polymerase sigma factor [Labilithrix luteola]AKU96003.1 RNA polymerase sigma-70 factor [Labilithrix luteola]
MKTDATTFETYRPSLLSLAYRMLGDVGRAEDMVQEAWVRWQKREMEVDAPKAFLMTTVTRLCLDELGSARVRHEESRSDRLPEPVDLDESGIGRVEMLDQISMAFVVLLQRLTPAERAVFLLHEVFDMSHAEIGDLLQKNEAACRQLLSRARENVAVERRVLQTSRDEHRRLLMAFVKAVTGGAIEIEKLHDLLAEDAVVIADAGPHGIQYGRLRNTGRPVVGRTRIISLMKGFAKQNVAPVEIQERTLNGEPAVVALRDGQPIAAILVSVADGQIRHIFLQIDPERLRHIGPLQ